MTAQDAQDARAQRPARLAAQVDWSKVADLYTGEQYGPDVLARLWATDRVTAGGTCMDLRFAAIGDGSSVSAAAAEILPFLVEAALDPDVTVRFEILQTIADIAGTGNTAPTAKVDRILEGRWRPTVDARWPAAWERAVEELLPLLDDGDHVVRAGAVRALAQSAAHADTLIAGFRARFDDEPDPWSAGCLVRGVGELARHATRRRDEALAWLRHRMTVEGKGAEPDIDEDVDAWLAWDEEIRHDVRLQAVEALCRALPGHVDPLYAPVTTAALLASPTTTVCPPAECFSSRVDVITDADRRLGTDLPDGSPSGTRCWPRRHRQACGWSQDRRHPDVPMALRRARAPAGRGRAGERYTSGEPSRPARPRHVRSRRTPMGRPRRPAPRRTAPRPRRFHPPPHGFGRPPLEPQRPQPRRGARPLRRARRRTPHFTARRAGGRGTDRARPPLRRDDHRPETVPAPLGPPAGHTAPARPPRRRRTPRAARRLAFRPRRRGPVWGRMPATPRPGSTDDAESARAYSCADTGHGGQRWRSQVRDVRLYRHHRGHHRGHRPDRPPRPSSVSSPGRGAASCGGWAGCCR